MRSVPIPNEPRRVALVITGLAMGGAEKCLTQLALNMNPASFQLEIYSLQSQPTGEQTVLLDQLTAAGIPLHFLNAQSLASFPRVLGQLRQHFRRQQPHTVQTFLYHANILGTLAARLADIRRVCVGIRVVEPNRWRTVVEGWVYSYARAAICVSESVRRAYQDRLGNLEMVIIPNGIASDAYEHALPADLQAFLPSPETPILLSVGRLHPQKGFDWLLPCLPQIFAQVPHHWIIVGDGPARTALAAQAKSLGIESRLHFIGWRPDVPALLKRADLLVHPSRYEGQPNVVLESMAAGIPCIATQVEGIEELLGPHAHDLTLPCGDSERLIERIVHFATHSELRQELGQALQARARACFSIAAMVSEYEKAWNAS